MSVDREEVLARACHQAWYAYTVLALGEDGEPWETAPQWQKDSIKDGIKFWDNKIMEKTEQPETLRQKVDRLAPLSHENWMKLKAHEGWVYGEKKDAELKTHHCMVPYADLPEEQRAKDDVVLYAYLTVRECF